MRGLALAVAAVSALWAQGPDAREREALGLVQARAYPRLTAMLRDPAFLKAPGRIVNVLNAVREAADPRAEPMLHTLAADRVFLADPDRVLPLLQALGAIRPMSEKTAGLFRISNQQGYFAPNAIQLAANGSPVALGLFQAMMLDAGEPLGKRIDCLHLALLPRRGELAMLRAAEGILKRTAEPELVNGVVESLFDYRREWFRPDNTLPAPGAWKGAPVESLRLALELGEWAQKRGLPARLRAAVNTELGVIRKALRGVGQ